VRHLAHRGPAPAHRRGHAPVRPRGAGPLARPRSADRRAAGGHLGDARTHRPHRRPAARLRAVPDGADLLHGDDPAPDAPLACRQRARHGGRTPGARRRDTALHGRGGRAHARAGAAGRVGTAHRAARRPRHHGALPARRPHRGGGHAAHRHAGGPRPAYGRLLGDGPAHPPRPGRAGPAASRRRDHRGDLRRRDPRQPQGAGTRVGGDGRTRGRARGARAAAGVRGGPRAGGGVDPTRGALHGGVAPGADPPRRHGARRVRPLPGAGPRPQPAPAKLRAQRAAPPRSRSMPSRRAGAASY